MPDDKKDDAKIDTKKDGKFADFTNLLSNLLPLCCHRPKD